MSVSESRYISLTNVLKLYDSASSERSKPMPLMNSDARKLIGYPLVKCACTSKMKNSPLGHLSSFATGSNISSSSTSQ